MTKSAAEIESVRPATRPRLNTELWVGIALTATIGFLVLFRDVLPFGDPLTGNLDERFTPVAQNGHLLGTDNLGRDLFARVIAGAAWSLSVALVGSMIACLIGASLGLLAAQRDGIVRHAVSWLVDATLSFPNFVLAIIVVAVLGHGFWPMTLTLSLILWPGFARVALAESLAVLQTEYVASARLFGRSRLAVTVDHVVPALLPSLSVMLPFVFAEMLVAESGLSFLGLGAPLGAPTWGNMLQEARDFIFIAPWMMAVPAGGIVLVVIAANLLGDGIRKYRNAGGGEQQ